MNIPVRLIEMRIQKNVQKQTPSTSRVDRPKERSDYHCAHKVGSMMDAWADVETAIQSAIKQRQQRLERLTSV